MSYDGDLQVLLLLPFIYFDAVILECVDIMVSWCRLVSKVYVNAYVGSSVSSSLYSTHWKGVG